MKNVLMISTNKCSHPIVFPLGLEYVASALIDEGYNVDIYESIFSDNSNELEEKAKKCDVICISFRNLDCGTMFCGKYFIDEIKVTVNLLRQYTNAPIIIGGQGFSLAPNEILAYTEADFGVIGKGEYATIDLLSNLSNKDKRIYNGNDYPIYDKPHRRTLLNYEKYIKRGGSLGFSTYGNPDNVVKEVNELCKYTKNFVICDGAFNQDQSKSIILMKKLIEENININYSIYIDAKKTDEEFVKCLKKSGCNSASISVGSINSDSAGRSWSIDDLTEMFELFNEYDVPFSPTLAYGFPCDTIENIISDINFCEKFKTNGITMYYGARLYPGTEFTEKMLPELSTNKENFRGVLENNDLLLKPIYYIKSPEFMDQVIELTKIHNINIVGK